MNTTHNMKTKLLAKAVGVAAATVATPTLLFAGAGTAHACALPYIGGHNNNRLLCPTPEASIEQGQYDLGVLDGHGLMPNPMGSS